MLRYFSFLAVILAVKSASAPFIKPCKLDDNACILESAQAAVPFVAPGIPELGIKSLDPMKFDVIKGNEGGLQLLFKNTVVTGMKDCSVDGAKMNFAKGKIQVVIRCSVDLNGDYKLDGQLLILPVQGEGKYTIKIRDIIIKAFSDIETVTGEDGKEHWHVKSWHHTFQVKTDTKFHFENLFNGNKFLAEPIEQFANSNWRDVMQEMAPPIVRAIVERVVEAVDSLYKHVPAEELYLQ